MPGLFLCAVLLGATVPSLLALPALPTQVFTGNVYVITQGTGSLALNDSLVQNLTTQPWVQRVSPEIFVLTTVRGQPVFARGVEPAPFLAIDQGVWVQGEVTNGTWAAAGASLASRLGLRLGDALTLTGSTNPRVALATVTGIFHTSTSSNDELLVPLSLARFFSGVAPSSYYSIRVETTDVPALKAFLQRYGESLHLAAPTPVPSALSPRIVNQLLLHGPAGLSSSFLAEGLAQATNSMEVVALGLTALVILLVSLGIHALQARSFVDRRALVAILKAIGASRTWLARRAMVEILSYAVMASLAGSLVGFLVAGSLWSGSTLLVFGHTVHVAFDPVLFLVLVLLVAATSVVSQLILLAGAMKDRPGEVAREEKSTEPPVSLETSVAGSGRVSLGVHLALVASLYALALALRYVPLTFSPLPFNVDGYPLAWVSRGINTTGIWQIEPGVNRYSELMPLYPLVWSTVSQLGGLSVLGDFQAIMPAILGTVVFPAYLLGAKATRNPVVGFVSGLFVAIFGSFLFLTSAAMKEALGLVVLPILVLLFAERADPRKRAIAFVWLVLLPLLSQLMDFLVLGIVAALVVLTHSRAISQGRFSGQALLFDCVTGPGLASLAYFYYFTVNMPGLSAIAAPDALALFLGVVTLLTASFVRMRRNASPRVGQPLVRPIGPILLVPALAFAALIVNSQMDLFAGVLRTQAALGPILLAGAVLAVFAFLGYQLVRRTTNRAGDGLFAMAVAPVALVLFAFLRGLDSLSQTLVVRSFDFVDYALAVLVGVGVAYTWMRLRSKKSARIALAATLIVALLATTPMAWNTQAVFGVNNVTTPAEYQALAFLATLHPANVTTDERLVYMASLWFGVNASSTLPFLLENNQSVSSYAYAVVLDEWTTVGAQVYPAPNIVLSAKVLNGFLAQNRVVYSDGPQRSRIYVVQITS